GAEDFAREECGQDNLRGPICRAIAEQVAAHRAEQAGWPETTDCDRLDAAFAGLQLRGIVARQNFSCCSNCGHGEMWGEMEAMGPNCRPKGYAFYHVQDTESAAEGGGLFVKYGAVARGEEAAVAIGRAIAEELRKAGLTVEWNGSSDQAVGVVGLDW